MLERTLTFAVATETLLCDGCGQSIPPKEKYLTGIDGDSGYSCLCMGCVRWITLTVMASNQEDL